VFVHLCSNFRRCVAGCDAQPELGERHAHCAALFSESLRGCRQTQQQRNCRSTEVSVLSLPSVSLFPVCCLLVLTRSRDLQQALRTLDICGDRLNQLEMENMKLKNSGGELSALR